MTPFIRLVNVSKSFGTRTALDGVHLDLARGECLGVTGGNGCGATTLLLVMAALLAPTSGRIEVDGLDASTNLWAVRRRLAYAGGATPRADRGTVGQYIALVRENRRSVARVPVPEADALLRRAGLDPELPMAALSTGAARRAANVAAIATGADLLLIDRPFDGLDERGRDTFLSWFQELRSAATTIVLATGSEREAQSLGARTVTLDRGRVVADRTAGGLDTWSSGMRGAVGAQ